MRKSDKSGNEVIVGMRRNNHSKQRQPGITGIDFWEGPFTHGESPVNEMEKFLDFPVGNRPAVLQRGVYRDEATMSAMVDAFDFVEMFNLERQGRAVENRIAASIGWYGFGKSGQLQVGVGVGLPGVIREQLQMSKVKVGEDAQRASDFRAEGIEKEVKTE